jgi:predicted nucleic acid-binding protein
MADRYERPYLDSGVYISAIKGPEREPPNWAETSQAILQLAEEGSFQVCASTLVQAEVIKGPGDERMLSEHEEAIISGYLEREFITWLDVDLLIARHARRLSRSLGLKPADAIHVATAIRANCDQLLTWDPGIHKEGRTIEGVYLCEPHLAERQTALFDARRNLSDRGGS